MTNYNLNTNIRSPVAATTTLPYYEYVIITDTSLVNGFTDFLKWKKRKGIDIGIVTTNDIYSNYTGDNISNPAINDNPGKVRQYLKDAHTNGLTTWTLIAGDYNTNVPVKFKNYANTNFPTDAYFSDLHANWSNNNPKVIPDIYVGRLICSDTTDIINWSRKVLLYEQNPGNGDCSYLLKAFSIQSDQLQIGQEAEKVKTNFPGFSANYVIWNETPSASATYDTNGYSGLTPGTTKGADVINEMNNRYGLFGWFCHGGTGGKSSGIATMTSGLNNKPYWKLDAEDANGFHDVQPESNNGLDNLTNHDYPSILYSNSCTVTPFDITSNIGNSGARNCGEVFTILPQTGGVAFLGNTRYGLVGLLYLMHKQFGTLIYTDDFHSHIGVAECISRYNQSYVDLYYSHNLIGCPEIQMWTATPQRFTSATVSKNGNVTDDKASGPVTIQSGANVIIDADGETTINGSFEVQAGAQFEIK